jgi:hypothetical protein
MSQLADTFVGMDPSGDGALLLCAIMAATLGLLLVVGFGLVRPPQRSSKPGARRRRSTVADLGVLSLWRLNRSLGKSAHPQTCDAPAVDSVKMTP